jgi:hypothetical protein
MASLFRRGKIYWGRAQRNNRGLRRSLKTRTEKLLSDVLVLTRLPPLLENGCVEKAISPLVLMAVVRRESYGPQPASSNIAVNNHTVAPDWTPYIAGPYRAAHG